MRTEAVRRKRSPDACSFPFDDVDALIVHRLHRGHRGEALRQVDDHFGRPFPVSVSLFPHGRDPCVATGDVNVNLVLELDAIVLYFYAERRREEDSIGQRAPFPESIRPNALTSLRTS